MTDIDEGLGFGEGCPGCGVPLFHAVPAQTMEVEIQEFYRITGVSFEDPDWADTWMYPRNYSTQCDWGVLTERVEAEE